MSRSKAALKAQLDALKLRKSRVGDLVASDFDRPHQEPVQPV